MSTGFLASGDSVDTCEAVFSEQQSNGEGLSFFNVLIISIVSKLFHKSQFSPLIFNCVSLVS